MVDSENIDIQAAKLMGGENHGSYTRIKLWQEKNALCASANLDKYTYHFAWRFGVSPSRGDKTKDLFVSIEHNEYLKKKETSNIKYYYKTLANADAELESHNKAQADKEAQKLKMEQQEIAQRKKREADAFALQQKRDAANDKRNKEFRLHVKEGDETHCGLVIETKKNIISVQSQIGQVWLRRDQIYLPGTHGCQFFNGVYHD
jgi:hypothetical protein